MSQHEVLQLAAFALGGLLLGAASFASLRLNTSFYLAGPVWRPICLHVVRLVLVAGALFWTAHFGAGPLLAAGAGVVAARPLAVRFFGRAS